jgi:FtsP/CotA-like multicopper oxidase with cupredoxin domain
MVSSLLAIAASGLILLPVVRFIGGDPLEGLPHAWEGAVEGGDPTANHTGELRNGGAFDVPTGGFPSPLFGAEPFSQKMLRFEEFGLQEMPTTYTPGNPFPQPMSAQEGPNPAELENFLGQQLYPEPTRVANTTDENPWKAEVEQFLGRTVDTPPAEGRPGGEDWAHQRWNECPPVDWFQSAMAGSRANNGLRDGLQRHGYQNGEFGPGGLYHNTAGATSCEGSCGGIAIKFHPNMPEQQPNSLWTFDGTLPPKLLQARVGRSVLFRHYNALPIDPSANFGFGLHTISTHEHNGHNPGESDGFANAFFFPGQYYDYRWPMMVAGHDSINTLATDPRCGCPEDDGGRTNIQGDYRQVMSTHWFHDHMLDFTAQNVYKGNAAMMNYYSSTDRGNEAIDDGVNLRFPSGDALGWGNRDYDVNLVVADKAWTRDGQLWFNIFNKDGFLGDVMTVNFLYKPYLDVRARKYRLRILNGSVSRYFKLALVDDRGRPVSFHMIANDGNVMQHAIKFDGRHGTQRGILPLQSIAERYDIIVDFSQFRPGQKLYLVNLQSHKNGKVVDDTIPLRDVMSGRYRAIPRDDDGDGLADRWEGADPCVGKIMEFRVHEYQGQDLSMDPSLYEPGGQVMVELPRPTAQELRQARHRTFEFGRSGGTDSAPWTIKTDGGDAFTADPRRLTAAPDIGDLEIWKFRNGGNGWSHPIHVHFEEGIILSKDGAPPPIWEWYSRKDVFRVGPHDESCREMEVAFTFREFAGTFVEHCHNTQHEDHAMLLRWDNEHPGRTIPMPTPIPHWDGVEFVNTHALPTAYTGDGFGPEARSVAPGARARAERRGGGNLRGK